MVDLPEVVITAAIAIIAVGVLVVLRRHGLKG
jgi:hypothetical protein